jgi:hypothetical protein
MKAPIQGIPIEGSAPFRYRRALYEGATKGVRILSRRVVESRKDGWFLVVKWRTGYCAIKEVSREDALAENKKWAASQRKPKIIFTKEMKLQLADPQVPIRWQQYGGARVEALGVSVDLPRLPGYSFVLHPKHDQWQVSELYTGMSVGLSSYSPQAALKNAIEKTANLTPKEYALMMTRVAEAIACS